MPISAEEFEQTRVKLDRIRMAEETETYLIEGEDLEMGQGSGRDQDYPARLGRVLLQFVSDPPYSTVVYGTIILVREWDQEAVSQLVQEIDSRVVDCPGGGDRFDRGDFVVDVFSGDDIEYYSYGDVVTDDRQRGIRGIQRSVKSTEEAVEELPNEVSATVGEVIESQYDEIEDIIQSDMDSGEKKKQILENIEVGLERGLPTVIYRSERSLPDES